MVLVENMEFDNDSPHRAMKPDYLWQIFKCTRNRKLKVYWVVRVRDKEFSITPKDGKDRPQKYSH